MYILRTAEGRAAPSDSGALAFKHNNKQRAQSSNMTLSLCPPHELGLRPRHRAAIAPAIRSRALANHLADTAQYPLCHRQSPTSTANFYAKAFGARILRGRTDVGFPFKGLHPS